ncbi:MAG: putative phospholipid-binding lipoprotein MlaA [Pseudomonadales bacterium]|nr:putative phospholipid-binding lipoprotein MlaA [Pseudomonadales bacterium]
MDTRRTGISALLGAALLLGALAARANDTPADPWEGFNRRVFAFNEFMDRTLLEPVASGYQAVTPGFVDVGVSNFFANLGEVPSFVNHVLQGRVADAGLDAGRFAVNTTLGIAGLFDVASRMGIQQKSTDFGVTLGRWGVDPGPYLVLPLLGPCTVRDGVGRGGDWFLTPVNHVDDDTARWSLRALDTVDTRADLFATEELITGDRYAFLRNLYLKRRVFLIDDGPAEADFDDDFDEDFDP